MSWICSKHIYQNVPFCLHLSLLPFQICSTKGPLLCLHSNGWRYFLPQPTWRTHFMNKVSVKYCSPYPTSEMPQNQRVVYTIMDFRILKLLPLRFWSSLIKLLQISRYHRMIRYMQVTFCNLVTEAKDSFQSKWKASCCGTSVAMACPIGWLCATSLMNAFFWASLGEKKRQRAQLGDLNAGSLLGSPPSEVFNCLLLITFQLQ